MPCIHSMYHFSGMRKYTKYFKHYSRKCCKNLQDLYTYFYFIRLMDLPSANVHQRLIGECWIGEMFLIGMGLFRSALIKVEPNKVN